MENTLAKLVSCIDCLYDEINLSVYTNSDKWKIINASYHYLKYSSFPILSKRLFKIVGDMLESLNHIKNLLESEPRKDGVQLSMFENKEESKSKSLKMSFLPSKEEVVEFITDKQLEVDAERFYHHYNAMGFKILGNPIYDWRSKALEWDMREKQKQERKREKEKSAKEKQLAKDNKSSTERKYSEEEIIEQKLFSDLDNIEI